MGQDKIHIEGEVIMMTVGRSLILAGLIFLHPLLINLGFKGGDAWKGFVL
jgi:hypothetical protein